MKLKAAMKLAEKHGKVMVGTTGDNVPLYILFISQTAMVTWRMGQPSIFGEFCNVAGWGERREDVVIYPEYRILKDDGVWDVWGGKTLARVICHAKYARLDQEGVRVEVSYHGQAIKQVVKVTMDDAEVCGGDPSLVAMAVKAIETGMVHGLKDWVIEHTVASCQGVILI